MMNAWRYTESMEVIQLKSCPLNHKANRKVVIEGGPQFKQLAEGANVKVIGQYHSGLEHTFLWIVDAKDAHTVETLMVQAGIPFI